MLTVNRFRPALLALFAGVATLVISWARLSDVDRNTLWAEDGRFFLEDDLREGSFWNLFRVYQGYLHVVPRAAVAAVVAIAPPEQWAVGIAVACFVLLGLIAIVVFYCVRTVFPSDGLALSLALLPAVLPIAPLEILGNLANLHWYLIYLSLWMVLARPRSMGWGLALGVVAVMAALTEIQLLSVLVIGTALQIARRTRIRERWPVLIGLAGGVTAQIACTVLFPRGVAPIGDLNPLDIAQGFLLQTVLVVFRPVGWWVGGVVAGGGWWLPGLALVPFVASFIYVMARGRTPGVRIVALIVTGMAVGLWVVGVVANRSPQFAYSEFSSGDFRALNIVRYGAVPSLLLLVLVVLACHELLGRGALSRAFGILGVVLIAAVVTVNFSLPYTNRSEGPTWPAGLEASRAFCSETDAAEVTIPIAPASLGWAATIPCEDTQ